MTHTIHGAEADRIAELLDISEAFIHHCGPALRGDLDELLRARGITGGYSWLIDSLGFTALGLRDTDSRAGGRR